MLRCLNFCTEKFRKLEFLMLFVNFSLKNEQKVDFPMPIVKYTYFSQYQWKKCSSFLILDLSQTFSMLRCFNVCTEKFRKLEFLMLFVNLALENGRNKDFPMSIVKTTYINQYQWKKSYPFLILDVSVDMPHMEVLALS